MPHSHASRRPLLRLVSVATVTERLRNISVAEEQGQVRRVVRTWLLGVVLTVTCALLVLSPAPVTQQDEEEHAGAHDVDTARGDGTATDTAAGHEHSASLDHEESSMRIHLASARSLEAEGVLPSPVAGAAAMYPPMEPFWMTVRVWLGIT